LGDERRVNMRRWNLRGCVGAVAVLGVFTLSLLSIGCGGGDNEDTTATATSSLTDVTIEIDPASGPPGASIAWSVSGADCSAGSHKEVELVTGPADSSEGGETVATESSEGPSGTISVPSNAAPGPYAVVARCETGPSGAAPGEIGVVDVGFEVTGEPAASGPATKEEWIAQAEAICVEGRQKNEEALQALGRSSDQEFEAFIRETFLPTLRDQLSQLRDLPPPKGDEDEVTAILNTLEEAYENVEQDPGLVTEGLRANPPLEEADRLAKAYGLKECT
jgi:hypothetical protein